MNKYLLKISEEMKAFKMKPLKVSDPPSFKDTMPGSKPVSSVKPPKIKPIE